MKDSAFGQFLYQLRTKQDLSQAKLGKMLGAKEKTVARWEAGTAQPNPKQIARLAEIFNVTVEELHAGKRLEDPEEIEKVRADILAGQKKYAILASVFLSLLVILPLLLAGFAILMAAFALPDDVAGPLGVLVWLVLFATCLALYIKFRTRFKEFRRPVDASFSPAFLRAFTRLTWVCIIVAMTLLIAVVAVALVLEKLSSDAAWSEIFATSVILAFTLIAGVLICLVNINRWLHLRAFGHVGKNTRVPFSAHPLWVKIDIILLIALLPVLLIVLIGDIFWDWTIAKLIIMTVMYVDMFALLVYRMKHQ